MAGELDSGLPIVRDTVLVGMIAATDLEFALDGLDDEYSEYCIMSPEHQNRLEHFGNVDDDYDDDDEAGASRVVHDFTIYVDPVSFLYSCLIAFI